MTSIIKLHKLILKYNDQHISIIIDKKGNPWFLAKHIASILKYKNTREATIMHVDDDDKLIYKKLRGRTSLPPYKRIQNHTIFINESGLYSLIFNSRQNEAKKFKKWVTSEVLPKIRKEGYYEMKKSISKRLEIIHKKYKKLQQKNKKLQIVNRKLKNKLDSDLNKKRGTIYVKKINGIKDVFKIGRTDNIMKRKKTYNTGEVDTIFVYTRHCENPKVVEQVIKHKFRKCMYKNDKELYFCPINIIKKEIDKIITLVDKEPNSESIYIDNII